MKTKLALLILISAISVAAQTPPQQFLYLAESHQIEGFSINPVSGTLIPVSSAVFSAGDPVALLSNSTILFAANQTGNSISSYLISSTGALELIKGVNPFVLTTATQPQAMDISPDGNFLFVASALSNTNPNSGSLDSFSLSGDGALTPVSSVSAPLSSLGIFVSETNVYVLGPNALQSYSVTKGVLTPTNLLSLTGATALLEMANPNNPDSSQSILFVAWNDDFGHIDSYAIQQDQGGTLSLMSSFNNQQLLNPITNLAGDGKNFIFTNQGTYSVSNGVLTFTGLNWVNPSGAMPLAGDTSAPFLFEGSQMNAAPPLVYPFVVSASGELSNSEPPLALNKPPVAILVVTSVMASPPPTAAFVFEPTSATFQTIQVEQSSTLQISVYSTGGADLDIASIKLFGDDAFTISQNTCPSIFSPGTNPCFVYVNFSPSSAASFSTSLVLSGNVSGSVVLSGSGVADPPPPPPNPPPPNPSPTITVAPPNQSAAAGTSTSYLVTAQNFSSTPTLTVSATIPKGQCSVSGMAVVCTTTASTSVLARPSFRAPPLVIFLVILGVGKLVERRGRRSWTLATCGLLISLAACGGGGSTVTKPVTPPVISGTPTGNYQIQINAVSGNQNATVTAVLVVN